MIVDVTTFEVVDVPRVIKVYHSFSETEIAVETLGIDTQHERREKTMQLLNDGAISTKFALQRASESQDIDRLFGHPRLIKDSLPYSRWIRDDFNMAYTQDLARPFSDILAKLDVRNEADLRTACSFVDKFIESQLLMIDFGIHDPTYKIADNYGKSAVDAFDDMSLDDPLIDFRELDIGELSTDFELLIKHVKNKEWEDIVNRKEYTQLPEPVQEYFNDALNSQLTLEVVTRRWNTGIDSSKNYETDRVLKDYMYDSRIPEELPQLLWRQNRR